MKLWLMRHGPAIDRESPDCPSDAERHLTRAGRTRVEEMCTALQAAKVAPTAIVSSPFARARETAVIVAHALGFDPAEIVETEALVPGAAAPELFDWLGGTTIEAPFCVGHAPHLDLVIAHVLSTRRTVTALKKSAVVALEIDSISHARGSLKWLIHSGLARRMRN